MTRDFRVLWWMAVVLGGYGAVLFLLGLPTRTFPALLLAPDPWLGMAVALAVALLAGFPSWYGFAGHARREPTQQGERWTVAQGEQALRRLLLVHLSAYAIGAMAWAVIGPPQVVDLTPFTEGQAYLDIVQCSTAAGAPGMAQWAITAMCRWSVWQWLPLAFGALLLTLGTGASWWVRRERGDLLAIEIDGRGMVLEYESKTRRIASSAIRHVTMVGEGLELVLRDGERIPMSLQGLLARDIGWLAYGIEQQLGEEEVLDPAVRARLAKMRALEG